MNQEIDKLAWLFLHNKKLLVVRSKGKKLFYLPGGKREVGETDQQALCREIKEELSVELLVDTIKYGQTFVSQADGRAAGVMVKLSCYFAEFQGELIPDAEIAEYQFLSLADHDACSLATLKTMEWLKEQKLLS